MNKPGLPKPLADAEPKAATVQVLTEESSGSADTRREADALELVRLRAAVQDHQRAERLQRALFAIADMASSELDMATMLQGLHRIVGGLMYAENLFIALYDRERDAVRFIYFADVADSSVPVPDAAIDVPMSTLEHAPTWYVIRMGRALMGTADQMKQQVTGPFRSRGAKSHDWLGVPMLGGGGVRGVLVVQSYVERPPYTTDDQALLFFVASHILTAVDRKQTRTELEREVMRRTAELALANAVLTAEVAEREHGERLQRALFRIAALSGSAGSMQEFYAAVHGIVGELINATNFYIALLSDDRQELHFPYWIDERQPTNESRPLRKGGTEYVIRRGQPALLDDAEINRLAAIGEVHGHGAPAHCWLGVPLVCSDSVVGTVVVQSYSPDVHYGKRDEELLTFVSYQIANSLERKRAAESLKAANAELEQRVAARTRELHEQIAVREGIEVALKQRNADLEAANEELAGTQSQLLQSEKMASVGQLAAGVAHEINNPIGYIRSNLTSLQSYLADIFRLLQVYEPLELLIGPDTPQLQRLRAFKDSIELSYLQRDIPGLLSESLEGIARVDAIVRDLKDFSHVDEAEWQEVDIHHGLDSTLNVAAHEIKYKAEVVKAYGDLPLIECLPFQLNQVFLNLLVNAAHSIELRGRITIRTGTEKDDIWLQFSDTGKGIPAENLKRIFDPFFTTKPVGIGTGLGLSVSYGIIKKHGGSIDVRSGIDEGTTFTIRLPIKRKKL